MQPFTYRLQAGHPTSDGSFAELTNVQFGAAPGAAVLRVGTRDDYTCYGPPDVVPNPGGPTFTAGEAVRGWAHQPGRTPAELAAAHVFLSQWDAGPQLPLELYAIAKLEGGAA